MKIFLLLCATTFAFVLSSCSDSTSAESLDASKDLAGSWAITITKPTNGTTTIDVTTGSNKISFQGVEYAVSYSGATATGTASVDFGGVTLTNILTITMKSKTTLEGNLRQGTSIVSTEIAAFTGTKK